MLYCFSQEASSIWLFKEVKINHNMINSGSQSVLKIQIIRPHPRPTELETGSEAQQPVLL